MFDLKPLSTNAIPAALAKAERYRLLNEPMQAASICEDVLRVEPDNARRPRRADPGAVGRVRRRRAGRRDDPGAHAAAGLADRLRARLLRRHPRRTARRWPSSSTAPSAPSFTAYDGLREAMEWFEKAEAVRPADNDDAILRWNACARVLMRNPHLQARADERDMPLALE